MYSVAEVLALRSTVLDNAKKCCSSDTVLFFNMLSEYGFRSSEIKNIEVAQDLGNNKYLVQTNKRGELRVCDFTEFSTTVNEIRSQGYRQTFPKSIQTYQSDFKRCLEVSVLRVGKKEISLHLFRHAKIKELYSGGKSAQELKLIFGIKSLQIVIGYIFSEIY